MCICASMWEVRMFVGPCTCGSQKLTSSTFLITLCLIVLRQGLLLNLKLVDSLARQQTPGIFLGFYHHLWDYSQTLSQLAIMPVLPIEVRASYICNKHFTNTHVTPHLSKLSIFGKYVYLFSYIQRKYDQTSVEIRFSSSLI